jgi:hypothetical protein
MVYRKFSRLFAFALLLVLCAGRSFASVGESALSILKMDVGPRAMGMGGAYTALSDDIYGMNYNPAGLTRVQGFQAGGVFFKGVTDSRMEYFAVALPLPFYGLGGFDQPRLGVGLLFSQNGSLG